MYSLERLTQVRRDLDLNYMPTCSLSDSKTYLFLQGGHGVDGELGCSSGAGLQETNKAASDRMHW